MLSREKNSARYMQQKLHKNQWRSTNSETKKNKKKE